VASIRERTTAAGDQTWQVLYRHDGKQGSLTFVDSPSAERMRDLINLVGPEKALRMLDEDQAADRLTLDQLAERFFEWKATNVEARTIRDYRRDYHNWISPRLGGRTADSLDELDVQQLVDSWVGRLDPKSIADRHAILSGIYRFGIAKSRRLVGHDPCQETQLPKRKKRRPKGFTPAEWAAMHEWGARHEPDADDLLLFIASTGWRFSEATPLTPAAVDDYGDVEVGGAYVPAVFVAVLGVHRRDELDRVVFAEGEAKSEDSLRRVNLPPAAARMLRRRLVGKGPRDLVFTSPTGRQWRSNNFLEREFARILAGAGIPKVPGMGPHYLRHLHVAMLDRADVSIAKTQRRIGHANISTTFDVYGGMIGNTLSPAELLALDAQVAPALPPGRVVAGELLEP
jgi:integrase